MDVDYVSHTIIWKSCAYLMMCPPVQRSGAAIECERGYHIAQAYSLWAMAETVAEKGGKVGLDHVLFQSGILSQRVHGPDGSELG